VEVFRFQDVLCFSDYFGWVQFARRLFFRAPPGSAKAELIIPTREWGARLFKVFQGMKSLLEAEGK
jgi:hypothetical protein